METSNQEKKTKSSSKVVAAHSMVAVKKDTKRKIIQELSKINKKDFGKKVRADELVALAMSLVTPEHLTALQESSLSHQDRLNRDYRVYISQHGPISKDEYLGKRLGAEVKNS